MEGWFRAYVIALGGLVYTVVYLGHYNLCHLHPHTLTPLTSLLCDVTAFMWIDSISITFYTSSPTKHYALLPLSTTTYCSLILKNHILSTYWTDCDKCISKILPLSPPPLKSPEQGREGRLKTHTHLFTSLDPLLLASKGFFKNMLSCS